MKHDDNVTVVTNLRQLGGGRRPSYRPHDKTCLKLLDIFRRAEMELPRRDGVALQESRTQMRMVPGKMQSMEETIDSRSGWDLYEVNADVYDAVTAPFWEVLAPGLSRVLEPLGAVPFLPDQVDAVVAMNMIGHLDRAARQRLWHMVSQRLAPGGIAVVGLQPPAESTSVPEQEFGGWQVGERSYSGSGRAEPSGPGVVTWHMTWPTHHRGELGLVMTLGAAVFDLTSPYWGPACDRIGYRAVLIRGLVLCSGGLGGFAVISALARLDGVVEPDVTFTVMVATRSLLFGLGTGLYRVSRSAPMVLAAAVCADAIVVAVFHPELRPPAPAAEATVEAGPRL